MTINTVDFREVKPGDVILNEDYSGASLAVEVSKQDLQGYFTIVWFHMWGETRTFGKFRTRKYNKLGDPSEYLSSCAVIWKGYNVNG